MHVVPGKMTLASIFGILARHESTPSPPAAKLLAI